MTSRGAEPADGLPFTRRVVSEDPRIRVVSNLAPPETCRELIALGRGGLVRAKRYAADGGLEADEGRTNSLCFVPPGPTLAFVQARIAQATGLPVDAMEQAQVLHYAVGQAFAPHYDFVPPDEARRRGQRMLTALVYLNDDFEGGETDFPLLGLRLKVAAGDALYFANMTAGEPDRRTLHAGLPPTRGEKWVLSQWIRNRAQPERLAARLADGSG